MKLRDVERGEVVKFRQGDEIFVGVGSLYAGKLAPTSPSDKTWIFLLAPPHQVGNYYTLRGLETYGIVECELIRDMGESK